MPKLIGEGTYGCVHKPSLKCKGKNKHRNMISKAMLTRNAIIELNEYSVMSEADKNKEYHLGKPTICAVDDSAETISALRKCSNKDIFKNINDVSLLVMKDGGINLERFSEDIKHNTKYDNKAQILEHFWLDMHNIIMGGMLLNDNKILHHDLKPQNIVYNMKTREINMIDFGLMRKKETYMNLAEASKYPYSFIHWSFPFETLFYNKANYDFTVSQPLSGRIKMYNNLINAFQSSSASDNEDVDNLRTFFNYINMPNYSELYNKNVVKKYWVDLYTFILSMRPDGYSEFIHKSMSTVDMYGIGIAVSKVLSNTNIYIEPLLQNRLLEFVYKTTTPNLNKRLLPEEALAEYEKIMQDSGLLLKYGVHYEDHKLVKTPENRIDHIPRSVVNKIDSIRLEDISIDKKELSRVINKKIDQCPPEKEMNPITHRCNKKCKPDMFRNEAFKCVSGLCPIGKEMNPKTRRCNKKCNTGYIRNREFKCIRNNKTRKNK